MTKPLDFQQIIMKLNEFWAAQGCVLWQPYNIQVGAGTGNPSTLLRALGPEPWRVAYVEPSVRPDDGRYGQNPNRMQYFYQYQVILKPDPGNPQELYLQSLEAIGINQREHDIRFVEDNWESPALGAWGLGWEVWLDGQEITQFTYFQQAGGLELEPVSVEITYGLERIALPLQGKDAVWQINWVDDLVYGDILFRSEVEHCIYYFEVADVEGLRRTFDVYEGESKRALEAGLVIPSYDYVLKCSHLFNVLDARGAIGVTERAGYFRRMRDMTRRVAKAYADQRQMMEYPVLDRKINARWAAPAQNGALLANGALPSTPNDFLFEIGVEELPPDDVMDAVTQLRATVPALLDSLRLERGAIDVQGTPRRLVVSVKNLADRQRDLEEVLRGPSADRAFDAAGNPTKAAEGFARSKGVSIKDLKIEDLDGGRYVTALVRQAGRPAGEVLADALPGLIAGIKFGKSMRWNATAIAFSRPIRWLFAMHGGAPLKFSYAGVDSSAFTLGLRPYGSPVHAIENVGQYAATLRKDGILLDIDVRRSAIQDQVAKLAASIKGRVLEDPALLEEIVNLVEAPVALLGRFEDRFLKLPREVLVTVMRKKQRYFAVENAKGELLPYFIAVRNGDDQHLDLVTHGNEQVLRARFADADYFFSQDTKKTLEEFLPRLDTLIFHEKLGSMLDKNQRVAALVEPLGGLLSASSADVDVAKAAAVVLKADLATQMVVEMTSLQGIMGREYALRSGLPARVADAIYEHWLPRGADDSLPSSVPGMILALADRLDSLVGLFAAGLEPTSTADPYGLRRAALGIIQIAAGASLDLDLREAVLQTAAAQRIPVSDDIQNAALNFIAGRLRVWIEDQGWRHDVVSAVLAARSTRPYRALADVRALTEWISRPEWESLLDGFARCVRITRSEAERYPVAPANFQQPEEHALYQAYLAAQAKLTEAGGVDEFLGAFAPMLPTITSYFGTGKGDGVLVNAPDPVVRQNRIGLLQAISAMQQGRADLSHLSGF
ncbi:MAG: glycine--tRNA ligase subunit beta [Chloroflexi bacterium]|nr:glycine--tRNA ligase subunit beta [Chloroflexota bacterium]